MRTVGSPPQHKNREGETQVSGVADTADETEARSKCLYGEVMKFGYCGIEIYIQHQNRNMGSLYYLDLGYRVFFYLRILRILSIQKPRFMAKNC